MNVTLWFRNLAVFMLLVSIVLLAIALGFLGLIVLVAQLLTSW